MEIQQGAVLKVEKIKDPVFVASKNFFNLCFYAIFF